MAEQRRKKITRVSGRRRRSGRIALRAAGVVLAVCALLILVNRWVDPVRGMYLRAEVARIGDIDWVPVPLTQVAPAMRRAVVAAEDANFCTHWGFDVVQIRRALDDGRGRGASTLTQQVVKNVYLWHGRSWVRKALEAGLTPVVEALWPKRRILEIYLNVAEFDEGIFGVEAAAQHYFGVSASRLSAQQAALLAAVLPDPRGRSASHPSAWLRQRAAAIRGGAALIRQDGRATCFED